MNVYIKGSANVSPQNTFGEPEFPGGLVAFQQVQYLKCIEPPYREFLDPMVARRMSRIVKMSVCCALKCMHNSGMEMPDAILAGTGLGCLEDTEKFLGSLWINKERLLNPTPFIQSTHNTVAGAIAMSTKCHGYNSTYTHRGFSFESALTDALLQLAENPGLNILAGAFDELTQGSYMVTKRLGLWKNHPVNSSELLQDNHRGSLPGEGVAFFMLSGKQGPDDQAILRSLRTFYKPADGDTVVLNFEKILEEEGLTLDDIDLVLSGLNGDKSADRIYHELENGFLKDTPVAYYKHLCGEYDTSTAFAMWLSTMMLKSQKIPCEIMLRGEKIPGSLRHLLIYNHVRGSDHVLYLLEKC